jgi:hypothetical protein
VQWFLIGMISSYDTYLTVLLRDSMKDVEENPMARWIMSLSNWDVSLFIGIKMATTIMVLGILFAIFIHWRPKANYIILPITIIQLLLLLYLEFHGSF